MGKIKTWFNIFKYSVFNFGEQKVTQFILFECKYLFSIIFFYFHPSDSTQDRFHTHAFKSISVLLFGNYIEEILDENFNIFKRSRNTSRFLYIPRNKYHRITKSTGCLTLLVSGRWKNSWKEYINGKEVEYSWNRKEL